MCTSSRTARFNKTSCNYSAGKKIHIKHFAVIKIANMQVYAVPGKFIMGNLRNSIHSLFYSSPDNNFDMKFEDYEDVIICQGTLDYSDRCRVLGILPIKRVGAEYFYLVHENITPSKRGNGS